MSHIKKEMLFAVILIVGVILTVNKVVLVIKSNQYIMGNSSSLPPLKTVASCNTQQFMGTWFVIAVKPTLLERTCSNAVEKYTFLENSEKHDIDIDFTYNQKEPLTSSFKSLPQKGWVQGEKKTESSLWKVSPMWPIKMPFPIIELGNDYDYCVIGFPNRQYCWIMSRKPVMEESLYNDLTNKLVEKHQYSLDGLRKVPQKWTREECEKRGLTVKEVPDKLLSKE
jgi:apolipoprotein D and lipocalin family protein